MAHLTKAEKRRMIAIRTDYAVYLRDLMASIGAGDFTGVIEFCNQASVRIDVESLLKASLSDAQATDLLLTPEATKEAHGDKFGRAHMIAKNMQDTRQLCRKLMRQGRMEGIGPKLAELLVEVEDAYAG